MGRKVSDRFNICRLHHRELHRRGNERSWWDNERAFRYGYRATGRAEDYATAALAAQKAIPADPVGDWYQGGPFCSAEFDGDAELAAT